MGKFRVVSDFAPTGDQPEAIREIADGILAGREAQTLMGVTGSGKLMHAGSAMRHNLEHKSARKRRELKADGVLATSQSKNMKKLLGR